MTWMRRGSTRSDHAPIVAEAMVRPIAAVEHNRLGRLSATPAQRRPRQRYVVRSPLTPNAACAAARRATGTRYGEQDT
jgi:hypothetical protein